MANPQGTPSDEDMNITDNNPNMGAVADDMDAGAGAPMPRPDRMGGTPMEPVDEMGPAEPTAYDEESDILVETPVDAEGAEEADVQQAEYEGMTPTAMNYAGGTASEETGPAYGATPDSRAGMPQGPTPSSTGVEGAGTREPGSLGEDTANTGLAGPETSPSNSGVVGQGLAEDGEPLPRNA